VGGGAFVPRVTINIYFVRDFLFWIMKDYKKRKKKNVFWIFYVRFKNRQNKTKDSIFRLNKN